MGVSLEKGKWMPLWRKGSGCWISGEREVHAHFEEREVGVLVEKEKWVYPGRKGSISVELGKWVNQWRKKVGVLQKKDKNVIQTFKFTLEMGVDVDCRMCIFNS